MKEASKIWPIVALLIAVGYVLQIVAGVIGTIVPWLIGGAVAVFVGVVAIRRTWPWS